MGVTHSRENLPSGSRGQLPANLPVGPQIVIRRLSPTATFASLSPSRAVADNREMLSASDAA